MTAPPLPPPRRAPVPLRHGAQFGRKPAHQQLRPAPSQLLHFRDEVRPHDGAVAVEAEVDRREQAQLGEAGEAVRGDAEQVGGVGGADAPYRLAESMGEARHRPLPCDLPGRETARERAAPRYGGQHVEHCRPLHLFVRQLQQRGSLFRIEQVTPDRPTAHRRRRRHAAYRHTVPLGAEPWDRPYGAGRTPPSSRLWITQP
ncbi:hypothetical protein STTU_0351 [Streptomyces sp. Tu6071]|nr:hypothetical protein STTU_0351 [Streptomyces sp. Tu6071]